ncbi:hydantoinase/oxoprolinase family protein [Euzebya sp.]|uniref:hydantoinase/oxoprolinase family protein n=1 Tax=Euzebya sp. TaxID=1971409 RepID=UPI0035184480
MAHRLGVDVGGTFTDVLLIDTDSGQTWRAKTASTPSDQSVGVLRGIERVCAEAGIAMADVTEVLHGTTVATNAILEQKGARVGLVTTRGFRQVLQIARSFVPGGLAGWIIWPKPEPLAALEHTVEAIERVGSDGTVVTALDVDDIRGKLEGLRDAGVEAVCVSLINSFANDDHEKAIGQIAAEVFGPDVPVSLSSNVLPELREYERTVTTVANGYVQPQVSRYITNLAGQLADSGVDGPLYILRSDGGLASAEVATANPVNMLLSGPAGGVAGAAWVAGQVGHRDFLTFDMGGTSTDVALVQDLVPRIGRQTRVGDLDVRAASVDVRTVGAGGGSIAHVPPLTKALRVGPQSAGADPGPAAYGTGGTDPTVTDANVVLGYLPSQLAGGEITLDVDAAREAVATIAEGADLGSVEAAAAGIIDIVNENMFGALRLVSVQQGFDPREFALVAFGGAGPLHANALGKLLGSWPVIIPPSPGVLCAYGDATTSLRDEAARTWIRTFPETSDDEIATTLGELAATARATLRSEGVDDADITVTYAADLRYHGQGFEIPVTVDIDAFDSARGGLESSAGGLTAMATTFNAEHERLFGFLLRNDHEVVTLRATATGPRPNVAAETVPEGGDLEAAKRTDTDIWLDGETITAAVYDRDKLGAGTVVPGPAIIAEMDSTTLVLADHRAEVHPSGSLLITPATHTPEA